MVVPSRPRRGLLLSLGKWTSFILPSEDDLDVNWLVLGASKDTPREVENHKNCESGWKLCTKRRWYTRTRHEGSVLPKYISNWSKGFGWTFLIYRFWDVVDERLSDWLLCIVGVPLLREYSLSLARGNFHSFPACAGYALHCFWIVFSTLTCFRRTSLGMCYRKSMSMYCLAFSIEIYSW